MPVVKYFVHPFFLSYNGSTIVRPICYKHPADAEEIATVQDLVQRNEPMEFEAFCAAFDKAACTVWSKYDLRGEDLVYGEDWDAVRRDNAKALRALPFLPRALLYAVDALCSVRCEPVVKVRDWLRWIDNEAHGRPQEADLVREDDVDEPVPCGSCSYSNLGSCCCSLRLVAANSIQDW